jgi:hypothetical protein
MFANVVGFKPFALPIEPAGGEALAGLQGWGGGKGGGGGGGVGRLRRCP